VATWRLVLLGRICLADEMLLVPASPETAADLHRVIDATMAKGSRASFWMFYASCRFQGPHLLAREVT
jgi:hypothetical protein